MRFVLNTETMDSMGKFVFNRFNDPSPKDHPSENTRFLYRENLNKGTDNSFILKKERRGVKKQTEEVFKKKCGGTDDKQKRG